MPRSSDERFSKWSRSSRRPSTRSDGLSMGTRRLGLIIDVDCVNPLLLINCLFTQTSKLLHSAVYPRSLNPLLAILVDT